MKILIIGSEGFIGSNCVDFFLKKKWNVIGVDLIDNSEKEYNYIKVLPQESNYESVLKTEKPDVCIFASGSASVKLSFQNPVADFQANTISVFNILNSIKEFAQNCLFVNLSSAAIYGNPVILPINENMNANPISPYGWHKYYSEKVCEEFSRLYAIKTCSLRLFSVFGPGQRKLLLWDIYKKIRENSTVTLYGSGNESRDFLYIDDLILAIDIIISKSEKKGEVYNVASGKETKIVDIAGIFIRQFGIDSKIIFNNEVKIGDPQNWRADISKIKKLGFNPDIDLNLGVKKYAIWLKENV